MSKWFRRLASGGAAASALAMCAGMAAQATPIMSLPVDRPMDVLGVQTACTGIGDREEHESRWHSYPVKLEAVGGYGQYLGDQDLTIEDSNGAQVLRIYCGAPWVLMRLEPGRYHAIVRVRNAAPKTVAFTVPHQGQRHVIVRFRSLMTGREVRQNMG